RDAQRASEPSTARLTRTIGALISIAESSPETKARIAALREGLRNVGWIDGSNVRIDFRFGPEIPSGYHRHSNGVGSSTGNQHYSERHTQCRKFGLIGSSCSAFPDRVPTSGVATARPSLTPAGPDRSSRRHGGQLDDRIIAQW